MKDLINDDVEEEGEESGEDDKKEESDLDDELDDDDIDLIQENLGVKIERKVCESLNQFHYIQMTNLIYKFWWW